LCACENIDINIGRCCQSTKKEVTPYVCGPIPAGVLYDIVKELREERVVVAKGDSIDSALSVDEEAYLRERENWSTDINKILP
jgi:hypothetical protein